MVRSGPFINRPVTVITGPASQFVGPVMTVPPGYSRISVPTGWYIHFVLVYKGLFFSWTDVVCIFWFRRRRLCSASFHLRHSGRSFTICDKSIRFDYMSWHFLPLFASYDFAFRRAYILFTKNYPILLLASNNVGYEIKMVQGWYTFVMTRGVGKCSVMMVKTPVCHVRFIHYLVGWVKTKRQFFLCSELFVYQGKFLLHIMPGPNGNFAILRHFWSSYPYL